MYETLLNQRNVLYVEQEIVEARRKDLADEYEISFNRLSIVTELGHGQFGKVYLAQLDGAAAAAGVGEGRNSSYSNDNLVAVKMSRAHDPTELQQDLLEEIRITKLVGSHPHLVSMIGCCTLPESPVCLVLEYMKGGDLLRYLHAVRAASGTVEVSSPLTLSSNDSPDELSIAEDQSPSSPSPQQQQQQQQQQHQPQFSRDSRVFFPNNDIKAEESGGCKFECSGGGERVKDIGFWLVAARRLLFEAAGRRPEAPADTLDARRGDTPAQLHQQERRLVVRPRALGDRQLRRLSLPLSVRRSAASSSAGGGRPTGSARAAGRAGRAQAADEHVLGSRTRQQADFPADRHVAGEQDSIDLRE
ncbi:unnamed protein product [Trichogramma brassicae]|uniref:Protein kinase domain-containing protein n=1 Tax=Trichogramma brassicae TaxID=86971 RepID=A0A6H5IPJ8_9HYME|nr:unnamed protein product [Trichogramma brassicae]